MKKFLFVLFPAIKLIFLTLCAASFTADNTQDNEEQSLSQSLVVQKTPLYSLSTKEKQKIYHSRESEKRIAGLTLSVNPSLIYSFGPKPREGGLGPKNTVEISPWVKSVRWINKIEEGEELDFVFDPQLHSIYIGTPRLKKVGGHVLISDQASTGNSYGGTIRRFEGYFRTTENSGHYGGKWHDQIRFQFIKLMKIQKCKVLHEPWVRDSTVRRQYPELYNKKIHNLRMEESDYKMLGKISEWEVFKEFSNKHFEIYQNNFLRKFGNSIFNMSPMLGVCVSEGHAAPSSFLYKQNNEDKRYFSLKEEFIGKGQLDFAFYNSEYGFIDPEDCESYLFEEFSKKSTIILND